MSSNERWLTGRNCAWLAISVLQETANEETSQKLDNIFWIRTPYYITRRTIIPRFSLDAVESAMQNEFKASKHTK